MTGFTDIHAHILPGIDDGPPDLAASVEMARVAAEAGTSTLVATPHLRADFPLVRVDEIEQRCVTLRAAIAAEGITLTVVPGAEISLVWALEATDDELRMASIGQKGSDLLIETPNNVSLIEHSLFQLSTRGYRVTLAHPERSSSFQSDPDRLSALVGQGNLLEVNAASLLHDRPNPRRRLAERLIRKGVAHVLASDSHRAHNPRPAAVLGVAAVASTALVGPDRTDWMTKLAPSAITAGLPIPLAPPLDLSQEARSRYPSSFRIFRRAR